ncbi:prolow-density lipoprotein receptor-related protein 1 [Sardina pilchardus]|uniref:prolow-density lipoprotein receptor-related protein 1 n=1 Tax=Sardina pilchardus TaxID=27697 RepID=UPI002E0F3263
MGLTWLLLVTCGISIFLSGENAVSSAQETLRCRFGQFACKDGSECISSMHVCDGESDCRDRSDEASCAVECTSAEFQCAHGQKCIDKSLLCDGVAQCQDQSDERDCSKPDGCDHQCDDKARCLPASLVCDGEKDCVDGTDELSCVDGTEVTPTQLVPQRCRFGFSACADGSGCISSSYLCDGEPDCKDGSDEKNCASDCSADQFQCAHGKKCIDKSQLCDGISQCQDRSDERDCLKSDGCVHQCDNKTRCLPETFLCDGEKDCQDGTDELPCAAKTCSSSEFRCSSGQCVSLSVRCDGHPDCKDRSDEKSCAQPATCPTDLRCPHSHECLLENWLCDGETDCKDETDEKNCEKGQVTCKELQWSCASETQCIPRSWKCDGVKDCTDESDESSCDRAVCPSHQFQCESSECVDIALVCNGTPDCRDGSDEGGACMSDQCPAADQSQCAHLCYKTPRGTKCGCRAGFKLQEDGQRCVDVDECGDSRLNICSHSCENTEGSFICHCKQGYVLEPDGHSCKTEGQPYLLAAVQSELLFLGLRSTSLEVLVTEKRSILSVDYDWQEQRVFWISANADSIKWSSLDQRSKGTIVKGIRADCIAVDWMGRNLYWTDGFGNQINAIGLDQSLKNANDYVAILNEDFEQPHSLALLPEQGVMFWSEMGGEARIERAGMDGSDRRLLIKDGLRWPVGLAVDSLGQRIYWTDEKLKCIGSTTFDGGDVKLLQLTEMPSPFSVSVINDMMIWSDTERGTVQMAHKVTGKGRKVVLKRPGQPLGLKVVHSLLQARVGNVCEKHQCSHLCVVAPGPKAVCKCPSHLLLDDDRSTCLKPKDPSFVYVLSTTALTQMYLQNRNRANNLTSWPDHSLLALPNMNEPTTFDFTVRDLTVYLADAGRTSVELFKVKDSALVSRGQLLHLSKEYITALAVDWVTRNLYWSSTKQPRLQVTLAQSAHTAVLIHEGLSQGLDAIALHVPSGQLCFVSLGTGAGDQQVSQVECAYMDGRNRKLVRETSTQLGSLTLSEDGSKVYWADIDAGIIASIGLDGSGYEELRRSPGLRAFALLDGVQLWVTQSDTTKFWYRDDGQNDKLWFEVSTDVIGLKGYSKTSQMGTNQCANENGGCGHLCLPFPGGRTCRCAHDHLPSGEDGSCTPDLRCPAGSKSCLDGQTCVPLHQFCDGHPHCPDHSDENCAHKMVRTGSSLPTTTLSPGSISQVPGTSAKDAAVQNLETLPCDEQLCNSRGNCVSRNGDISCACSLGYGGDFCQDQLSGLWNPLTYGAAAGGAGLLVVIVVVAVLKRRTASNQRVNRANTELGETSMEVLEKPEPLPSEPPSAKDPGHLQNVASSVD